MRRRALKLTVAVVLVITAVAWFIVMALPGDQLQRSVVWACEGYRYKYHRYPDSWQSLLSRVLAQHRDEWTEELTRIDAQMEIDESGVTMRFWGPLKRHEPFFPPLSDKKAAGITRLYIE